jgi:hypothetical protein
LRGHFHTCSVQISSTADKTLHNFIDYINDTKSPSIEVTPDEHSSGQGHDDGVSLNVEHLFTLKIFQLSGVRVLFLISLGAEEGSVHHLYLVNFRFTLLCGWICLDYDVDVVIRNGSVGNGKYKLAGNE